MEKPTLPRSFDGMSKNGKSAALARFFDKALAFFFKTLLQKHVEPVFQALAFQESSAAEVLLFSRRIFEIGEAHARSSIIALSNQWADLPRVKRHGSPPFPLSLSNAELREVEEELRLAMRSQEVMNAIKQALGDLFPEKGVVRHDQYDEAKAALRQMKTEILERFAKSPQERAAWEKAWPFDD